ncbi:hypothetical protein [Chitinophaga sp. YIM B06452]|uniref:hypothetical protein n=1 Tax=Chitinophaga sp. YIM B06452 TaxID=3082158 RepID=UPI0031FF0436
MASQVFDLTVELVDDAGEPSGVITSYFDIVVGFDSNNKNVFVVRLREFPPTMPTNFRLMVTITHSGNVIYKEVTESYAFVNDQCVTAYVVSSLDWGRIVAGRLVINGQHYQVGVDGTGLPVGYTLGVNNARQETSLAAAAGLTNDIYGLDVAENRIEFQNAGTICAKGSCSTDTILVEGIFDCKAPDGRFVGSVFIQDEAAEYSEVRFRYFARLYADLIPLSGEITRTIALNNKVQRTERIKRYQLAGYVPMPSWQKEELETILMGAKVFLNGRELVFTTGRPFESIAVTGMSFWLLKAELQEVLERKEYSCEVVCLTCLKPTGLSFEILPVPCSPLTGLQATVTLQDDDTVTLEITGANTAGASHFLIGYRVQGSGLPYTAVTPNPVALPVLVSGLAPAVYEVQVTKVAAASSCAPQVVVSNATSLSEFDYLVVRYLWTDADGRDLDTFTGFINTGTAFDNDWVGYGQGDGKIPAGASDADAYLFWASDNTASGVEAVMANFKKFVEDNAGTADEINVRMNAVWWSQRLTGDVQVQLTTYLGGTMEKVGFDFVNTGGVLVDQVTLNANVAAVSQTKNIIDSTDVAIIRYNKLTKEATIQLV